MPRAIQHDAILNVPDLDLVLLPGEEQPVTQQQAEALQKLGVTILPDTPKPKATPTPPAPALSEEHDR